MNNAFLLSPLRQSVRQFNRNGIEFHINQLSKKSRETTCSPRLRVEIQLETVKALRVIDRIPEAIHCADLAIANIPADSFDILSALKRVRALMYLDGGDYQAARNMIDDTDGLELTLEGGRSLVTRSDDEVQVETWLVSVEIALAMGDIEWAEKYFNNAVNRLAIEESGLRRKRINPREKKGFEQYYHDLGQMLSLYGLTLRLMTGDPESRKGIAQLCSQVEQENTIALAARKLPNVPLLSRLLCLLGEWAPDSHQPPPGICLAEARRWSDFGAGVKNILPQISSHIPALAEQPEITSASALVSIPNGEYSDNSLAFPSGTPSVSADGQRAFEVTAAALERMANVFTQIEKVLPNFASYLKAGDTVADFSKRGFSGHLMDTDLYNFMQNFLVLQFTGYLQLKWNQDLYKVPVHKGILSDIVLSGEAHIYVIQGITVDAVFAGQLGTHSLARAQENFITLTRMCLNLGVDGTRPDIHGYAVPEEAVAHRARLLNVRVNDLLFITADIESELAGLKPDEQDSAMDVLAHSPVTNDNSPMTEGNGEKSFADLNLPDLSVNNRSADFDRFENSNGAAPTDKKMPADTYQPATTEEENLLELI